MERMMDADKVRALIHGFLDVAKEKDCTSLEVAQAARSVFEAARTLMRRGLDDLVDDALREYSEPDGPAGGAIGEPTGR